MPRPSTRTRRTPARAHAGRPDLFRPGAAWQGQRFRTVRAGELVVTSGEIVACDPLVCPSDPPLHGRVEPGRYPVLLAVTVGRGPRVAQALVRLREGTPVDWEPAIRQGEQRGSFGVDSGTGCFMDRQVARALAADEGLGEELSSRMTRSRPRHAALPVGEGSVVGFATGAGDGVYPCFWGVDEAGRCVALLADFWGVHPGGELAAGPRPALFLRALDRGPVRELRLPDLDAEDEGESQLLALAGHPRAGQVEVLRFTGLLTEPGLGALATLRGLRELSLAETALTDAGLAALAPLENLRRLDLSSTRVTRPPALAGLEHLHLRRTGVGDRGLAAVARMPRLRSLVLGGTAISDGGLRHLRGLRLLEQLDLSGTRVDDAALELLRELPALTSLNVDGTGVSLLGAERFQRDRPGCRVAGAFPCPACGERARAFVNGVCTRHLP